jgi:hypothetical protein
MRKLLMILVVGIVGFFAVLGYRVALSELANIELQDDMKDIASQMGTRIGYAAYGSDDALRAAVLQRAEKRGIELEPNQVTVEHMGSGYSATIYLAVDYTVLVDVPGIVVKLHFTPATDRRLLGWRS